MITLDFPIMLGFTVLLLPFALDFVFSKLESSFFMIFYLLYIITTYISGVA